MTVPKGRADKAIVDGINEALTEADVVALIADEDSDLYASLVALIAAETGE